MTVKGLLALMSANIKTYRVQQGLTQAKLAESMDVSNTFLSSLECGRQWLSLETFIKLANVLKIEPYELLRPRDIIPDDPSQILEQYSQDISEAIADIKNKYKKEYARELESARNKQKTQSTK